MAALAPSSGLSAQGGPADLPPELERFKANLAGYLKPEELETVCSAYRFSAEAHSGQFRTSGDPYISHPLAVAETLAGWHLDAQALTAALLHDVMEDTDITKAQIAECFGKTTAELVDGVSKLDRLEHQSYEEAQAENYRKMLLAMARDVRVILIKLADRLHNMRTLEAVKPEKRRRVARETLEIYAPIANRLGLNTLCRELQELAFRNLYPLRYAVLAKAVKAARGNRREVVGRILHAIEQRLPECGIVAEVQGREKHLYSIYRKMREKQLSFSQVLDIYGFRIIVKDVPSCYLALGALHGLFKPIPGKFKDYIAIPKVNGYQSLHTTLIGPYGTPVEIQIRTGEMHHVADAGVASHWLYKDEHALTELQQQTHKWLQSLIELQSTSKDSAEFLEHVKFDLFPSEVYVFTPRGKILVLPRGATPVDFAYAVHTDIGNRCVACQINFESMPLRTELRNGDRVEIITAPHASPNPAWLSYVRTGKARSHIRHFLKTVQQEQSAKLGERMLLQALGDLGAALDTIDDAAWERLLRDSGVRTRSDVLTDIGLGKRYAAVVARRLLLRLETGSEEMRAGPITISGTEGMAVQLAPCCRPIPGDSVVGSIKKGQGLVVHVHDCPAISKSRSHEADKWLDVEWAPTRGRLFDTAVRVLVEDRRGVLARVTAEIAAAESNIVNVRMEEARGGEQTSIDFVLQVADRVHLATVLRALRRLPEVLRIERLKTRKE